MIWNNAHDQHQRPKCVKWNEKWEERQRQSTAMVSRIRFSLAVCSHLHYRFKFSFFGFCYFWASNLLLWSLDLDLLYYIARTAATEMRACVCVCVFVSHLGIQRLIIIVFVSGQINCSFAATQYHHTKLMSAITSGAYADRRFFHSPLAIEQQIYPPMLVCISLNFIHLKCNCRSTIHQKFNGRSRSYQPHVKAKTSFNRFRSSHSFETYFCLLQTASLD